MVARAPPILANLCPYPAQVHGSRLRLPQVSPADSGEYVCRVENDSGPKEASIIVSVLHSRHPGPGYTPGEEPVGEPSDPPRVPEDGAPRSLRGHLDWKRCSHRPRSPPSPRGEMRGLTYRDPHGEGTVSRIRQEAAESGLSSEPGVRLTWVQVPAVLVQPASGWLLYLWASVSSRVKWGEHPWHAASAEHTF